MPGYANPDPTYQPALRLITAITNAEQAEVTTSFDHDYLTGLVVRIDVPNKRYGMIQIDKQVGTITVTGDTTFTIDINTTQYDPFTLPSEPPYVSTYPSVIPIGEVNSSTYQATRNVL